MGEPNINPTRDGGVSIEWDNAKNYLEIEISAQSIEYLFKDLENQFRRAGPVLIGTPAANDFFIDLHSTFAA